MKIAVSSTGKEMLNSFSDVFGRCPYFIFFETKEGKIIKSQVIKNEAEIQSRGAGTAAAQLVANEKVDVAIAKSIGPRATEALNQFGIKTYNAEGKIKEIIDDFVSKK